MERDETTEAVECKHRWVLGQPRQGVVPGRCRYCGAERDYPAVLEDFDRFYGPERTMSAEDLMGTGAGGARPSSLVPGVRPFDGLRAGLLADSES